MNLSVNANLTLRNFYTGHRNLITQSNRSEEKNSTLSFADASALRKAIAALGDFDYDNATSKSAKSNLTTNLKAFIDTYNYTIDSSEKSTDSSVTSANKSLKRLTSQYGDDLKKLGISVDAKGYMSLSSSATTNISGKHYASMFGSDSDYLKQMNQYAKRITSHVNVYL